MKGYVKLRRGILDHFKVMSSSEIKVYIGVLILANFKTAVVNITLAELAEIISLDKKITMDSLHRLDKFGYVKYTPAKNQWHTTSVKILKYNAKVNNTIPTPTATPTAVPTAVPTAKAVNGNKDKELPESQEVLRSIKKREEDADIKFIVTLKTNFAYSHIDIDTELGKMDAWLLAHKGRKKTRRFVVNWLNKIEKPLEILELKHKYGGPL